MMKQHKRFWGDFAYAAVILVTAFALNLFLLQWIGIFSVTPMVFVLGVFLIAWRTQGYFWGKPCGYEEFMRKFIERK